VVWDRSQIKIKKTTNQKERKGLMINTMNNGLPRLARFVIIFPIKIIRMIFNF
jgi:hypothetical protein